MGYTNYIFNMGKPLSIKKHCKAKKLNGQHLRRDMIKKIRQKFKKAS